MVADSLHWFARNAPAVFAAVVATTVVTHLVRRLVARSDLDRRQIVATMASGLAFLGVKTLVGRLLFVGLALYVYDRYRLMTLDLRDPFVWLGVFVIRDAVYYWVHRLEHRVQVLWASHMVHHSPSTISVVTALRVPWMEALYKPWFSLWLPLLGFNPLAAVAFDVFAASVAQFQHTERCRRRTVWDRIVVTPAIHRVHHGSNPIYIDKNFGAIFSVWDHLFGTYQAEIEPVVYGIGTKRLETTADVLAGGYPALCSELTAPVSIGRKARFLLAAPGSPPLQTTR